MTGKLSLFIVCCIVLPCSAFAQLDAFVLRAKYGVPLARETFQVRPNIEAIVNYGTGRQVCRIELPPGRNVVGEVPDRVATTQQVDEVIYELVPPTVRGKEIRRMIVTAGRLSVSSVEYEHVDISEPLDPDHPSRRTGVTIAFNRPGCR